MPMCWKILFMSNSLNAYINTHTHGKKKGGGGGYLAHRYPAETEIPEQTTFNEAHNATQSVCVDKNKLFNTNSVPVYTHLFTD
jgi:hypothetical protein